MPETVVDFVRSTIAVAWSAVYQKTDSQRSARTVRDRTNLSSCVHAIAFVVVLFALRLTMARDDGGVDASGKRS